MNVSTLPNGILNACGDRWKKKKNDPSESCRENRASMSRDGRRAVSSTIVDAGADASPARVGPIVAPPAVGMIAGFGVDSYVLALEAMVSRLRKPAQD